MQQMLINHPIGTKISGYLPHYSPCLKNLNVFDLLVEFVIKEQTPLFQSFTVPVTIVMKIKIFNQIDNYGAVCVDMRVGDVCIFMINNI